MGDLAPKDHYERNMLEMVLRRKLPGNCDVRIEVNTGDQTAAATFSLRDSRISVESDISSLNLQRILLPSPPNW